MLDDLIERVKPGREKEDEEKDAKGREDALLYVEKPSLMSPS